MPDLLKQLAEAALGSRLRRLAEMLSSDAGSIYQSYSVGIEPSWFPIIMLLSQTPQSSIKTLAEKTGHSHVFVSKIVKQMRARALVSVSPSTQDKRSTLISLTAKAKEMLPALSAQTRDVGNAMQLLTNSVHPEFMALVDAFETALRRKSLSQRTQISAQRFNQQSVQIVPYNRQHAKAFYDLNKQWIEQFFVMEPSDYASLENPDKIIEQGGSILLAMVNNDVIGTCALIKMNNGQFELAKMAVSPVCQGMGIGYMLGQAVIDAALDKGASQLYLESNRQLTAAINLYRKLGFTEVKGAASPYARCDIQMALALQQEALCKEE